MGLGIEEAGLNASFSNGSLEKLVGTCVDFYRGSLERGASSEVCERRRQLSKYARKFHRECGTLTRGVEESIERLENGSCLFVMSAHQPNLFAYGGVFRKITLTHIIAERLAERLDLPVVCFFGVADHDFTDDRWVRLALLPDVERRNGTFELRVDLPAKIMLSKTAKLSRRVLDGWRDDIRSWLDRKMSSLDRSFKALGVGFSREKFGQPGNFEEFWGVVEEAYAKAETYSDFNAFFMSKVVNVAWGYPAVFARFSECQRDFEPEFRFLLSHFEDYSRYVKDAMLSVEVPERGVYQQEYRTVPFWYHCDCGSKARLMAELGDESFIGRGTCLVCGKEYEVDFSSKKEPRISGFMSRISTRSLSLPLVFFRGLDVCCYVGGVAGQEYLQEAKYVADHMGMLFPPVVIWRPLDTYFGVGQLDALLRFRQFSGTFDLSQYSTAVAELEKKIADIEGKINWLVTAQKQAQNDGGLSKEAKAEKGKLLSVRQTRTRRARGFTLLKSNLKLLENVETVMHLFPCIVDYAVNVGLKATSEQWIKFLKENGDLSSNVRLRTDLDLLAQTIQPGFSFQ